MAPSDTALSSLFCVRALPARNAALQPGSRSQYLSWAEKVLHHSGGFRVLAVCGCEGSRGFLRSRRYIREFFADGVFLKESECVADSGM